MAVAGESRKQLTFTHQRWVSGINNEFKVKPLARQGAGLNDFNLLDFNPKEEFPQRKKKVGRTGAGVNDFSSLRSPASFGADSLSPMKAPDPPVLLDFAAPPVDGPTGTHLIPSTVPNRFNADTYETKPDQTIYQSLPG